MKLFSIIIILSLSICLNAHSSIPNWKKISKKEGITVSRTKLPGMDIYGFRGETIINASAEKLYYVILDNQHRIEWVDRLAVSRTIERVSEFEYVVYQKFDLPWPLSDRDYVYRGKATRDPETGKIHLVLKSENHPKSPKVDGVRAELKRSAYIITPLGPNKSKMEVEIVTDPKGWLPSWIVNLVQKSWPYKTLNSLKNVVVKPWVKGDKRLPETKIPL